MNDATPPVPEWIEAGRGKGPSLRWTFTAEGALTALDLAGETGELFASDESGALYRLDRGGRIASLTRLREPVRALAWSASGLFGAALAGDSALHGFDRGFQSVWRFDLPEACLALAVAPFGNYIAVSMADGRTVVLDAYRQRVAEFETIRPLAFLRFCAAEPVLIGAAEHGLLCCHALTGEQHWQENLWGNAGDLATTGAADLIYLACFAQGIQTHDADGASLGSYILDGTVNRATVSFEPHRLAASTLERHLYWLDADGEMLWVAVAPDDVTHLRCDPLGEWLACGLGSGRVMRLDWGPS